LLDALGVLSEQFGNVVEIDLGRAKHGMEGFRR